MPGIVAIISPGDQTTQKRHLEKMANSLHMEDFYRLGTYSDEKAGLYISWACHPGSYSDCMPAVSKDGNWTLFFYGEHHGDRTSQSTQTANDIVHSIEAHGMDIIKTLNGWFHGLIINKREQEITVFNDRSGMQRLYTYSNADHTYYSSEAKPLLAIAPQLRSFDPQGLADFITCGCVLQNNTLFRNVVTLPAATLRLYKNTALVQEQTYFHPSSWESQPSLSHAAFVESFVDLFPRVLQRYSESNLPLAVSLTGGFDTRLIMAWLAASNQHPQCFTFGGMYRECFDVKIARKIASLCQCDHQVLELGNNFLESFDGLATRTVLLSGGTLGATNAYELYLNTLARKLGSVRLTGSYGSEVMRGARAFKAIAPTEPFITSDLQSEIQSSVNRFTSFDNDHPISFSVFKQAPWFYFNRLCVEQAQVIIRTPYLDNDVVSLFYRRPPDVSDTRVLLRTLIAAGSATLATLPTDTGNSTFIRHLWSQFLFKADYCYKSGMPQWLETLHHLMLPLRPEKVFAGRHRFAHYRIWFREQLKPYLQTIILDGRTESRPFFNHKVIQRMLEEHISGRRNHTDSIERVLTIELAARQFLDN